MAVATLVPNGCDLVNDLNIALKGDFKFEGNYYYAEPQDDAPIPSLCIEGVGVVGIPLSERDAKAIIASAAQAPFGKGTETVIDTTVRDTWEIDASKITFRNPRWLPWIQHLAATTVCKALGVSPTSTSPKCELYKLLLYQKGSHFRPHQDTEKAAGMFATVVVVLPSIYEGGQVCVSHVGLSKTIDFSGYSASETCVLAWYTDVMHEVKTVTSGYRLALSFNLVNTPGVPRPTLPDMSNGVATLRQVLQRWAKGEYPPKCIPGVPFLAYILDHQYSTSNLDLGLEGLKGADLHRAVHLIPIADELGFEVAFANISYTILGIADDSGYTYHKRYRYSNYNSDDEKEVPKMWSIDETTYTISNIVDPDGDPLFDGKDFEFEPQALVPKSPFKGLKPDKSDYEGYMGNGAGSLSQWYNRSVFMLYKRADQSYIALRVRGVNQALLELEGVGYPDDDERDTAVNILRALDDPELYLGGNTTTQSVGLQVMDYATKWEDLELWSKALVPLKWLVEVITVDRILAALDQFPFAAMIKVLTCIVQKTAKLTGRLDFVEQVANHVGPDAKEWAMQQRTQSIASYDPQFLDRDIPPLMKVAKTHGLGVLEQSTIKSGSFRFWITLALSIHREKPFFLAQGNGASVDRLVARYLEGAGSQWRTVSSTNAKGVATSAEDTQKRRMGQAATFLDACLTTGFPQAAAAMVLDILNEANSLERVHLTPALDNLYIPLLTHLRPVLARFNQDMASPCLGELIATLVHLSLTKVLGSRNVHVSHPFIRKLGCGACQDCHELDAFLTGPATEVAFRQIQQVRTHLEHRLAAAKDIVTHETIRGRPRNTLVVRKLPSIVEIERWENRVQRVCRFLATVGSSEIRRLLGSEAFGRMNRALAGDHAFLEDVSGGGVIDLTNLSP